MTIAIRSTGATLETTAQSVECPAPASIVDGDILRLKVSVGNDVNITVNETGWIQEAHIQSTAGIDQTIAIFTKKAVGAGDIGTDYTVDIDGGADFSITVQMTAFSGVDATTWMDAAATTLADIQSANVDGPAITTVTDLAWVESFIFARAGGLGAPTAPAGYTLNGVEAATNAWFGSAYKEISPAAAEDPAAFVFGGSVDGAAITIAFRPVDAGTTQKASSDAGSFGLAAELSTDARTTLTFDQAVFSTDETLRLGKIGILDDVSTIESIETASVFSNLIFPSADDLDPGNISATESSQLSTGSSLAKAGVESVSTIDSVESSALVTFGETETKAATDVASGFHSDRINRILHSDDYSDPAWETTASTLLVHSTPEVTHPLGGISGVVKLTDNGDLSQVQASVGQTTTPPILQPGLVYTHNVFARYGSEDTWIVVDYAGGYASGWFKLSSTGTVLGTASGTTFGWGHSDQYLGQTLPDGWVRLYINFFTKTGAPNRTLSAIITDGDGVFTSYLADQTKFAYLFNPVGELNANLRDPTIISVGATPGRISQETVAALNTALVIVGVESASIVTAAENAVVDISGTVTRFSADLSDFVSLESPAVDKPRFGSDTFTNLTSIETAVLEQISFEPHWEDDDISWGGLQLGSKDFAPVFVDGQFFFVLGRAPEVYLDSYLERKGVVFENGLTCLGRGVYPQLTGAKGQIIQISLGGHDLPDDAVDWEGPYDFIIGEDVMVDFAVAGRYLAIRFESKDVPVWQLQSFDIDYEVIGRH